MSLELINGQASESANEDAGSFFAGTVSPRRYRVSETLRNQAEDFLEAAFAGRKSSHQIAEAFSTSDFTLAAFAAVDSRLMAEYQALPSVWRQYTDTVTVNDFRPTRLLDRWSENIGLKLVPELTEYPASGGQGHATYWINVAKYGLRDAFSWEASINNTIISEIEAAPKKYARASSESEAINALANILGIDTKTNLAATVNTDFFKSGNGNAPDNRALTAENLDAVLGELAARKPQKGRLVAPPQFVVVIPAALEPQMKRIQALREIRVTDSGTGVENVYDNYLGSVEYVVEPMLDAIFTHAKAKTTWFVLPKPGSQRPALFTAFLRGHESPDLRYKADTGQRIGGGAVAPEEGSFDIDDIQTRVRHVLGHQAGDPLFTYVSYGS